MNVDKELLLKKLQKIIDRNEEDKFLKDAEEWALIIAIGVIESIEEEVE